MSDTIFENLTLINLFILQSTHQADTFTVSSLILQMKENKDREIKPVRERASVEL